MAQCLKKTDMYAFSQVLFLQLENLMQLKKEIYENLGIDKKYVKGNISPYQN